MINRTFTPSSVPQIFFFLRIFSPFATISFTMGLFFVIRLLRASPSFCTKPFLMHRTPTLYLLGIFFLVSANVSAQNSLFGSLHDESRQSVVSANVLLLNAKDSTLYQGVLSSSEGMFQFSNVPAGNYLLKCSMVGLKPYYSNTIILDDRGDKTVLDPIVMQASTSVLDEVSVVAKRPFLEQKIDRTVVNVANSITQAGGTALQVLQRSPGVQVNLLNKTISLAGKQGIVLMINGKMTRMPADVVVDMLNGMNADNIDRIELIHTPPANFEAEGNAGIIHIILKKSGDEGLNGGYSANAGYGFGGKYGGGGYLNYRKKKMNWFGAYNYNYNLNPQVFTNYRGLTQNGDFLETETYSDRPHTPTVTQDARLGADFQITKKTVLGFLGTFMDRNWYMEAVNGVTYTRNGVVESRLRMPNSETNHSRSVSANVNINHTINENHSLNFDADWIQFDINNPSNYQIQPIGMNNPVPEYQLRIQKNTPIKVGVVKADYTIQLNNNSQIELGGKITSMRFVNDVRVDSMPAQKDWVIMEYLSSLFRLNESVGGSYASFSTKIDEKTDFKAGLRYEYTRTNLGSETMPNVVDRKYGSWFPSVFLTRKISENQSLNASFSRRITRPQIAWLAPWLIFSDPTTLQGGNPALQPSFTDAVQLNYRLKTLNMGISYSITDQPMSYVPGVDPVSNRQLDRPENLDKERTLSAFVNMPFHPVKWWEMSNNVYLNTTEILFQIEGKSLKINNITYGFNSTQTFQLPSAFTLEVSGNFNAPSYWGIAYWRATGSLNLGLEKNFGEKWGKLRFNASDLFLSSNWFGIAEQPEVNLLVKSSFQMAERTLMLSWSNTFGNRKLKSARERQTGAAEELRRL